jgi:hypothetical protein
MYSKVSKRFIIATIIIASALVLAIYGGISSARSTSAQSKLYINCSGLNLEFNYSAQKTTIIAPLGKDTFNVIYLNNTGNSTYNISISGQNSTNLQLLFAKSFNTQAGQSGYYTEYEIINPTTPGNYTENITLTSLYKNCMLSKYLLAHIEVINDNKTG